MEVSQRNMPWNMWFSLVLQFHNGIVRHLQTLNELADQLEEKEPILGKLIEAMIISLKTSIEDPILITQAISFSLSEEDGDTVSAKHPVEHKEYIQSLVDLFGDMQEKMEGMSRQDVDKLMKTFHMTPVEV